MATGLYVTPKDLDDAALKGMMSCIRDQVRAKIMEIVQPDIDAAVDAACEQFKVTVAAYKEHGMFREMTIRAIVERK